MNEMKEKPVVGLFIPLGQYGVELTHITMSFAMLSLLNYKPDQFAMELISFGSQTFKYQSNHTAISVTRCSRLV
jgi:hypothetical protein